MPLNLPVTAGTTLVEGVPITVDEFNLLGEPTVSIEDGSLTPDLMDTAALVTELGDALRATNWLPWGTFYQDQFLSTSLTCTNGIRTAPHPGWYVKPAGADLTASPSGRTSATATAEAGKTALKVIGNAALTSLEIGSWLPPGLTQPLRGGNLAFSVYVWNNTGTAFTPSLKVYAANALGDEGNTSLVSTVSGTSCPTGQWTRQSFAVDASGLSTFVNGAHVALSVTVAAGILDSGTDYILVADAQIDKGVTTAADLKQAPPLLSSVPAGIILPFGGPSTSVPPGWLLCDGTAVSRTKYATLFQALGTAHGSGDGSTTFNLPDGRGRSLVGAEVSGASQGRMEVSVAVSSSSGDTMTVAVGAADSLRLGMGAYGNAFIPAGATIIAITNTTIQLSAATTGSVTGTVRFSKLGGADPETVGAAGNGPSYGRNEVKITKKGCVTATSTTLTVPGLAGLACGMSVSSSANDIPAGTTIDAFLSATTVRLSAAATGSNSNQTVTFGVNAPEGNQYERYLYLQKNPKIPCTVGTAADSTLQVPTGINYLLDVGMTMTALAGAGLVAGTYVSSIDAAGTNFDITPATSGATPATYDFTFSAATLSRTTTPTPDTLPAFMVNMIVKY